MPKLSVIIPVYNVAPYLRACLDSVLAAVREVEKVGGGGDERKAMGKGSDPLPITCRFRVIHQKNAGVSAARNAALDVATGVEW